MILKLPMLFTNQLIFQIKLHVPLDSEMLEEPVNNVVGNVTKEFSLILINVESVLIDAALDIHLMKILKTVNSVLIIVQLVIVLKV